MPSSKFGVSAILASAPPGEYWGLCPRCGQEVTAPFMQWVVPNVHALYFHSKCVDSLILALKRDIVEHRHGREFARSWYTKAKGSTDHGGPRLLLIGDPLERPAASMQAVLQFP